MLLQDDTPECSCIDCELSCETKLFPEPEEPFEIFSLNGGTVIAAIVVCSVGILTILAFIIVTLVMKKPSKFQVTKFKTIILKCLWFSDTTPPKPYKESVIHKWMGKRFRSLGIGNITILCIL